MWAAKACRGSEDPPALISLSQSFLEHKPPLYGIACRPAFELANYARSILLRRRSPPVEASVSAGLAARETSSPNRTSLRWMVFLSKSCLGKSSDCSDRTARANPQRLEFSRRACGPRAVRRG